MSIEINELFKIRDNYLKNNDIPSRLVYCNDTSSKPFLSVCIPTYKIGNGFLRTLQSLSELKNESHIEYNIIIVDDYPGDSMDVKKLLLPFGFSNVKYYKNEKNLGLFGNWNRCIELSDSNYVAFLHDDDLLDCHYLDSIYRIIKKYEKKGKKKIGYIKCSSLLETNGQIHMTKAQKIKRLFRHKCCKVEKEIAFLVGVPDYLGDPTCGSILSKEAFLKYGGFDETLYPSSDAFLPFFMLDEYDIYFTVAAFGVKVYGENVSCKFETLGKWARMFSLFQDYLGQNYDIKKIQDRYLDAQYALYLETFYEYAKGGGFDYHPSMFNEYRVYKSDEKTKRELAKKVRNLKMRTFIKGILS